MKRYALALLAAGAFGACTQRPPEAQAVDDAAAALGGKARILAIKTIVMDGEGTNGAAGGGVTPDAPANSFKVSGYRRTLDLANGRMRLQQIRTAQFPFALATVTRQDQRLDGDVAFNIGGGFGGGAPRVEGSRGAAPAAAPPPDPNRPVRASDAATRDRRAEMLAHPIAVVRAALDPMAKITNLRTEDNQPHVDVVTAKGDKVTVGFDAATKVPSHVTWMSSDPNWGDIVMETSFSGYQDVGGLKLPTRVVTKQDQWMMADINVTKNAVDADAGDLAAPAAVKAATGPQPPPPNVTVQQVGKGIWWLAGGTHHSVLFEFDEHLVLFEVPLDDARTQAVIAKAKMIVPNKPLTHATISHHHLDHAGGFRAAVVEGLTIVTHRGNEAFLRDIATRKHTIEPDTLAKNPKPVKFELMDDAMTLKDKSLEVDLYQAHGNIHSGLLIYAWVPRDRMLVQADFYDNNWLQHPWGDNFIENVRMRRLDVNSDVPAHGIIQSWADVVKTIESKRGAQAN